MEIQNESNSSDNQRIDRLEGWTKEEKFYLLQAVKQIGSQDVAKLCDYVPSKSEDEIRIALEFYNKKITEPSTSDRRKRKVDPPVVPLAGWAKLLADSYNLDELQTETAAALRLIAEFEDRPPGACTEKFDFKKIYSMMADALEGNTLQDDNASKAIIDQCVVETAFNSKNSMRHAKYKELIGSVSLTEREICFVAKPTTEKDLAYLRPIIAQRNYNPLNISEVNCKLMQ